MGESQPPRWAPALSLVAAAFTETTVYPIDSVKTWLQVSKSCTAGGGKGNNTVSLARTLADIRRLVSLSAERGGVRAFFHGAPLAVARNSLSTMIVMSLQGPAAKGWQAAGKLAPLLSAGPLATKVVVSSSLSVVANSALIPLETLKIRLQADGRKAKSEQRYASVLDSFLTFRQKNGTAALWTGSFPTFARSAAWWSFSVPIYSEMKTFLTGKGMAHDHVAVHTMSSVASGFFATLASQPFDMIKTQLQNSPQSSPRSSLATLKRVVSEGGIPSLWSGFIPRYARLGPWQLIFFVVYEQSLILFTGSSLSL